MQKYIVFFCSVLVLLNCKTRTQKVHYLNKGIEEMNQENAASEEAFWQCIRNGNTGPLAGSRFKVTGTNDVALYDAIYETRGFCTEENGCTAVSCTLSLKPAEEHVLYMPWAYNGPGPGIAVLNDHRYNASALNSCFYLGNARSFICYVAKVACAKYSEQYRFEEFESRSFEVSFAKSRDWILGHPTCDRPVVVRYNYRMIPPLAPDAHMYSSSGGGG